MCFITDINDVIDSQMMQYFVILDGIAVYPFRIMEQRGTDAEHGNIHVHCYDIEVGTHKLRAIDISKHSYMR